MIEVAGKQVFTEISEIVDPAHTALVLVDMQRDFCLPGGAFGSLDVDLSMYPTAIEKMVDLLTSARRAGVLPVFIQMTSLPGRASDSPAQIRFNLRLHQEPCRPAALHGRRLARPGVRPRPGAG